MGQDHRKSRRGDFDMSDAPQEPHTEFDAKETALVNHLMQQLASSLWNSNGASKEQRTAIFDAAMKRLFLIGPKGPIEGMLAVQMIATHEAAMECLRRAMLPDQLGQAREANLRNAARLMGIYERQAATFDPQRRKGQQNITVKYIHVAEGAQAIVGDVSTGSKEESNKNPLIRDTRSEDRLSLFSGSIDSVERIERVERPLAKGRRK
jgi:hypothetical protein